MAKLNAALGLTKKAMQGDSASRGLLRHRLAEHLTRVVDPGHYYGDWGLDWTSELRLILPRRYQIDPRYRNRLDRIWTVYQYARATSYLQSPMVEFGVFEGVTGLAMLEGNLGSLYIGVDSFSGLSRPDDVVDGDYWREGDLAANPGKALQTLSPHNNRVQLVEGWIPGVLEHARLPEKVSFVHIDVDLYVPTLESLKYVADRLEPGGLIICDDYGFSSCPGARMAVDTFVESRREFSLVHLPTGQALVSRKELQS